MWAEFLERPLLETYKTLKSHAKKAGERPEWRNRSLAKIRLRIAMAKDKTLGQTRPRWMQADDDHSALVKIFLYENDPEAAWREAQIRRPTTDNTRYLPRAATARRL